MPIGRLDQDRFAVASIVLRCAPSIVLRCVLSLVLLAPALSLACDCFPPELRAKTAQEALQKASVAVYGRVVEVNDGAAKLRVLESFKGPAVDTVLEVRADDGQCPATPALQLGAEVLVLSFGDVASSCDSHPREHYLVEALRSIAAKNR